MYVLGVCTEMKCPICEQNLYGRHNYVDAERHTDEYHILIFKINELKTSYDNWYVSSVDKELELLDSIKADLKSLLENQK